MTKQFILLLSLMTVAGVSYAQVNDTVRLSQDTTATISDTNFYLSPSVKALEEVKITADRPLYTVDGEKNIYNTADDPSVQTGTASDALQNAPGVEVDAEGNITLRGSQSVEVWINDRPSNLSGESLRQYIKTLPANSIARIEVITNPSARYGGSGPVVNIITSKKILRNEFISIGATGNLRPQVSPWLSYVYSNKKFTVNLYAEYDYSHTWSDQSGRSALLTPQGDTSTIKSYTAHNDNWRHGSYFYLSGNYDFDTMRSLSFWGGAYPSWYRSESSADIQWQELIYNPGDYSYRSTSTASIPQVGYYGGLHYSHRLDDKGQMLWIRTAANGFNYTSDNTEQRQYLSLPALDYTVRHLAINRGGVGLSAEVGYSLPFAEHWELEAGVTGDYQIPSIRTYTRDTLPGNRRDTLQSYNKYYRHEGYGSYFTLKRNFGNFAAKVGLRLEQSIGTATYTGYTTEVSRENYLIPSPSVHLSYRTPSMHNFTLSYTLRTTTPSATDLTRFIVFSNESYEIGNPDLLPSHTHNLEGGWNKYFEGFGSVGVDLYYKANTDGQGTLVDVVYHPVYGREVSFSQPYNIGSSHTAGADINLTYRPTAMFNLRLSARAVHMGYHSQFRPGEWVDDNLWAGNLRLNVWGKLWNVLQVFGNVNYTTRQIAFLSSYDPFFTTDLGVSADLLDRHLSLYLNVKDVFNTYSRSSANTNPYLSSNSTTRYSSRYISFGVTVRLGKMELESKARGRVEN